MVQLDHVKSVLIIINEFTMLIYVYMYIVLLNPTADIDNKKKYIEI